MSDELKEIFKDQKGPLVLRCSARAPYDGCWHEPNYWLLRDHKVYPLYISGDAWDRFEFAKYRPPWLHGVHFMSFLHAMEEMENRYEDWDHFDPEDWELDNYNVLNSITVLLMQHQVPLPKWTCSVCSETCRGRPKFLGYRGNGGIGVFLEDPCCTKCFHEIKWCEDCGLVEPRECGVCPNLEPQDDRGHVLHDVEDEAEQFGLTGRKFLGPYGDAEGLEGISIVVATK